MVMVDRVEDGPLERLSAQIARGGEVGLPVETVWVGAGADPIEAIAGWIALARETPRRLGVRAPLRGVMAGVDEARVVVALPAVALDGWAGDDPHRALLELLREEAAQLGRRGEPLGRDWPELFPRGVPVSSAPVAQAPPVSGHTVMLKPGLPPKPSGGGKASAGATTQTTQTTQTSPAVARGGALGTAAGSEDEVVLGELLGALASAPLPGRARALVAEIIARAIHDPSPQELRRALAIVVSGEVR